MTSDDERPPNTPTSPGGASERARELWSMSDDAKPRDTETTRPGPTGPGSSSTAPTGGSHGTAPWERVPSAPISAPSPPRGRDLPDSGRPGPRGPLPPAPGGPAGPGGPGSSQRPGPPPGGPRPPGPGGPGQPGGPRPQPPRPNGPGPTGDPGAPPRPAGAYTTGPRPRPVPGTPPGNPGPLNPAGRPPAGHRPPPGTNPVAPQGNPPQSSPTQRTGAARPDALGARPGPAPSRPEPPRSRPDALDDETRRSDAADATMFVKPPAAPAAPAQQNADDTPGVDDRTAVTPVSQAYSANTNPAFEDDPEDNVAPQSGPRLNRLAVWALILSGLGITFPIGLVLGYRARAQIRRTRGESGLPFANVAIWLGWAYLGVLVFGLVIYSWILFAA
ncbi:DUF4190 domain-containing protein [Gordonia sp. GN26]